MDASEQAAEDVGQLIVQVYAIHEVVILETGGMDGLRDSTMLHDTLRERLVHLPVASQLFEHVGKDMTRTASLSGGRQEH